MNYFRDIFFKKSIAILKINDAITEKTAQNFIQRLKQVSIKRTKAIALLVNSPGGSPSQSEIICDQILFFCKKHKIPLYTFANDLAASGGYFILCIGDKVYVDSASIVGSIGAISFRLSLNSMIKEKRIERRRISSNENTFVHQNDILSKIDDREVQMTSTIVKNIHEKFIDHVLKFRNEKLKIPQKDWNEVLFNGNVWIGEKTVDLGLADFVGNYEEVMKKEFPNLKQQEILLPQEKMMRQLGISNIISENSISEQYIFRKIIGYFSNLK